ncbi:MAG: cell division ATP-binding protein FtsE [Actinomycetales bacterium]|nr:cell division ATP-binding protein FtsE [Actinomycetales bacterium]
MIRFDQVTKTYSRAGRPALHDVTVEILGGEFVFLVGASGSGKSSFLRLVLKEERPTRGDVHVLGRHLNTLADRKVPYFRRDLGVVFQDFRLLPGKTVFDNVAFSLQVIGKSKGFISEAVPDVLKLVGLAGKQGRMPHELSGGEQQRVAIARAVVNKPAILLADEPTGNLDPATSSGIMQLLSTINANGTTVVMATHDVGIVDQMRRRVIELVGGQVVRDERQGGYQTSAVPVHRDAQADPAAERAARVAERERARAGEPAPSAPEPERIPAPLAVEPRIAPPPAAPSTASPGTSSPAAPAQPAPTPPAREPERPAARRPEPAPAAERPAARAPERPTERPTEPAAERPAPVPLPDLDDEYTRVTRRSEPSGPPPLNEPPARGAGGRR